MIKEYFTRGSLDEKEGLTVGCRIVDEETGEIIMGEVLTDDTGKIVKGYKEKIISREEYERLRNEPREGLFGIVNETGKVACQKRRNDDNDKRWHREYQDDQDFAASLVAAVASGDVSQVTNVLQFNRQKQNQQ